MPCEVSNTNYEKRVFGTLIDFSETPGTVWGPPPLVGQHSREILAEFGFAAAEIEQLVADSIAFDTLHVTG